MAWVENSGEYHQEQPALMNRSDAGICVMMNRKLTLQSRVGVYTDDHPHVLSGVVRHVTQKGMRFRTGLEFPSEVHYRRAKF